MPPPSSKKVSERPTNFITKSLLTETDKRFADVGWYFTFVGQTFSKEEEFGKWSEMEIGRMLISLHQASGGMIGQFPTHLRDLDRILRRMLMLGLYLGGRRFGREVEGVTSDIPGDAEHESTALVGEVGPEDFRDTGQVDSTQ